MAAPIARPRPIAGPTALTHSGVRPRLAMGVAFVALLLSSYPALGQGPARSGGGGRGLDLTIGDWGIGIGDVPRVNGVRLNFADRRLDRVNGINLTLWKPGPVVGGSINGIALGVFSPKASMLRGIVAAPFAPIAERSLYGIGLGGLAVVAGQRIGGAAIGGLAVVSADDLVGVSLAGLATVVQGRARGILIGGLATVGTLGVSGLGIGGLALVSERDLRGIGMGGLATVASGRIQGLAVGGLASVANGSAQGLLVGGLAVVTEGRLEGIGVGGLAVVSRELRGVALSLLAVDAADDAVAFALGPYRVRTPSFRGVSVAGWGKLGDLTGLSVAGYNQIGTQVGVSIGLFNSAAELRGLQLGLLNHAGNNPTPFRWLPLINAHFD